MTALSLKTHHFHTKLPYQKPMLRQINSWLQNGPITKNGVLPVANLNLILFQFKDLLQRVDLLYQQPKCPFSTFCKRCSFIWRCFFPVVSLNVTCFCKFHFVIQPQPAITLIICYHHATHAFQNESTLYSCLNVKELLARNRRYISSLRDSNGIQTHNHLNRWMFV